MGYYKPNKMRHFIWYVTEHLVGIGHSLMYVSRRHTGIEHMILALLACIKNFLWFRSPHTSVYVVSSNTTQKLKLETGGWGLEDGRILVRSSSQAGFPLTSIVTYGRSNNDDHFTIIVHCLNG